MGVCFRSFDWLRLEVGMFVGDKIVIDNNESALLHADVAKKKCAKW